MSKISLIKGKNRKENIIQALNEFESELKDKLANKNKLLIKVDLTSDQKQEVSTHRDSLEAVISFLSKFYKQTITVAGFAGIGSAEEAFKNFNYYQLKDDYDLEFIDLNKEKVFKSVQIYSRDLAPLRTNVPQKIFDSDFIISLSGMKMDDSVIAAMGLKNISGCMTERPINHNGYKAINLSIAKVAQEITADFSIIDAFKAIEGEGPARGDVVEMKIALAGFDFVSVDTVGSLLMGLNPYKIGYLSHCADDNLGEGDVSEIKILGNTTVSKAKKKFRTHSRYEEQLQWE
jgi:uncharacterized protein (DUF362 family)